MEKYYFCSKCDNFAPWDEMKWSSDDGKLENMRMTCKKCGGHVFTEKIYEHNPPKPKLHPCVICGQVFGEEYEKINHQSKMHGVIILDDEWYTMNVKKPKEEPKPLPDPDPLFVKSLEELSEMVKRFEKNCIPHIDMESKFNIEMIHIMMNEGIIMRFSNYYQVVGLK